MLGALTNRTPVTGDALPRAARLHAAAGHERHSCGELSAPWLSAPFVINILLFTTEVKQCIPFSPPCDCSYELKITFCVRGVISPLLSNIFLHEVDRQWCRGDGFALGNARLVRYADDMVLLARTEQEAREAWTQLQAQFSALHLIVNQEKSRLTTLAEGFAFLGFEFRKAPGRMLYMWPREKACLNIRHRVREVVRSFPSNGRVDIVIQKLNPC